VFKIKHNLYIVSGPVPPPSTPGKKNSGCACDAEIKKSEWIYNSIPPRAFITEHGQMFDMFHSPYKVY
jgi:hypothetical protein